MKKMVVLLLIILATQLSAEWISINPEKENFREIETKGNSSTILFTLDGYNQEYVTENGKDFVKISHLDTAGLIDSGKPDLPVFSAIIAIPNEGNSEISVISTQQSTLEGVRIYPLQPFQSESNRAESSFTIDENYYLNGSVYPENIVSLSEPAIMRDFRIVTVTINPFIYNPATSTLTIIENMEIEVITEGKGGVNEKVGNQKISRVFEPLYRSTILNYDSICQDRSYNQPTYLFIYNNNGVVTLMNQLIEWKKEKGFNVVSVSTTTTGNSMNQIRTYIQNAYDNWENPPDLICLMGDASGTYNIPSGQSNGGEGDHYYTLLDGNDIIADVAIGRLSFNNTTDLATIVSKILMYEKNPYMDNTDWYEKALLVGDPSASGPSTVDTKIHVRNMISEHKPNYTFDEVYNGDFISGIASGINNGVSYFNYRGYYGMSGWDVPNINNLTNGSKLPVAVFITCGVGNFVSETCRSEAFLRAGTPTAPKGAIAAIATSTSSTHTCFNNIVDGGIFYGIFAEKLYYIGNALLRGKLALYKSYPANPSDHVTNFSYWNNLMGDPGLETWTGIPQNLVVTVQQTVPLGQNYLAVQVKDISNQPVSNAWVTLYDETLININDYTDENGFVYLPLNVLTSGDAKLTVSSHDFIPYQQDIEFLQENVSLSPVEFQITDTNGNNDGIINPGETFTLKVKLMNYGLTAASGITTELSTDDENIDIQENEAQYSDIGSGAQAFPTEGYTVNIDESLMGDYPLIFNMQISGNAGYNHNERFVLNVAGPKLTFSNYTIYGGDSFIDPGETCELSVMLSNLGTTDASGVTVNLSTGDQRIEVIDSNGSFGNISSGASVANITDKFVITAFSQLLPGMQIPLTLTIESEDGYNSTSQFMLSIGVTNVHTPLGPDVYGYVCYDDEDEGFTDTPEYEWIEIEETGTYLNVYDEGNHGVSTTIDLPIAFSMYGREYDQITICSDGWLAPGVTDDESFMNWAIPGPMGPSPMIAPFWDDLKTSTGWIFYHHDSASGLFIVEWKNMYNQYDDSEETFQAILFDSNLHPTSTGDSKIKFQYQEVHNTDQGSYDWGVEHGCYATVGIEDHTGLDGIGYTFNNSYPGTAKTLENEMAILFMPTPIFSQSPYLLYSNFILNDDNQLPTYGETLNFDLVLSNAGMNASDDCQATISTNDPYVSIINNSSEISGISGGMKGVSQDDFVIDIADNCPDGHRIAFAVVVTDGELSWDLSFNISVAAPVVNLDMIIVDDDDNYSLDPGETANLLVYFDNSGGYDLKNATITFNSSNPGLTIQQSQLQVGDLSHGSVTPVVLPVQAAANLAAGTEITITCAITGESNFNASTQGLLVVSANPVILETDFSGVFPPAGWTMDFSYENPWQQSYSAQAGSSSPELVLWGWSVWEGYAAMNSPELDTRGCNSLELSFKHKILSWYNMGDLRVDTSSDGSNWHQIETFEPVNTGPEQVIITIDNDDIGSQTFQFRFYNSLEGWNNIEQWYIDDVAVSRGDMTGICYLSGNITLSGGEGQVNHVIISNGENSVSPAANGNYLLPLVAGQYNVSVSLPGYTGYTEFISCVDGQLVRNVTLDYLAPPQNLQAVSGEEEIILTWQMPQARTRELELFRIYRSSYGAVFAQIDSTTELSYTDQIFTIGNYRYYVVAKYTNGVSLPSAIAEMEITHSPDDITPSSPILSQNYPNPFNPVTKIEFYVPVASQVELEIFNIKGQKVKVLANNQYEQGYHELTWKGKDESERNVGSGVYFYRLKVNNKTTAVKKCLLLK